MSQNIQIFHNPRCSKSRASKTLLEEKGIEAEVVEYLKTPPSSQELQDILQKLGIPAKELIRFGEKIAKELGITKKDERSEKEWVGLMADYPQLIERPIIIRGDRAVIGRPTEKVLELL